jgi:uncharacterized protein YodC (DUF2158 family)
MSNEIVPGDTVYLKSGSPKMVVAKVENGVATVVFSVFETQELKQWELPLATLQRN